MNALRVCYQTVARGIGPVMNRAMIPSNHSTAIQRIATHALSTLSTARGSRLFTPVSPALGAEVSDITLTLHQDRDTQFAIQAALDRFSAIVFRNQHITGNEMVESFKFLGPVAVEQHHVDQKLTLEGCPECFRLRNDEKNPPLFDFWHCDKTAWVNPVRYTILSCRIVPPLGGDTLVACTRKAFASMSEGMKRVLRGTKGVYNERNAFVSNPKISQYLANKGFNPHGVYDHFTDVTHPVVRTNPRTSAESLYFSPPYLSHFEGFTESESRMLEKVLTETVSKPEFVYRHRWNVGDILVIDNSATSHYALADFFPEVREMHRIIITERDRP